MTRLPAASAIGLVLMLAAPAFAQAPAKAAAEPPAVDAQTVREIEGKAVLPKGAAALSDYDRYYDTGTVQVIGPNGAGDLDVIQGVWLRHSSFDHSPRPNSVPVPGVSGAFTVGKDGGLPLVMDGGCSVITVYLDVKTRQIISRTPPGVGAPATVANVRCNGLA